MNQDLLSLLITQTWQITLLIVIVWTVVRLFARERPHLAHALWVLVLIKCLTPPIWSSPTSAFSWMITGNSSNTLCTTVVEPTHQPELVSQSFLDPIIVQAVPETESSASESPANILGNTKTASPLSRDAPSVATNWPQIISWVWMIGVTLGLLVTTIRFAVFLRWIRKSETSNDPALNKTVRRLSQQLGVKRRVRARVLKSPVGPAVLGLLRPTVLLPESIVRGRSFAELEPLIAHELIHVRRGDLWWALVQTTAKSLFWFHPLVWFAGRMATRESERSCDEETVACLGCRPAAYAKGLLEVLEHKHRLRVAPALPGVRPVEITSARLERVMNLGNGIHRRTPVWVWLLLLSTSALVLPGAALVIAQEQLPQLPKQEDASPLPSEYLPDSGSQLVVSSVETTGVPRLETYPVADLVASLNEVDEIGQFDLTIMLGCPTSGRNSAASTNNGMQVKVGTPQGTITLGDSQPTMRIVGGILYAFATDERHAKIAESLARFRKFGFRSVIVEARMLNTSIDKLEDLGIEWSIAPVAAKGVIGSSSEDSDPLNQKLINEYAAQLVGTDYWPGDVSAVDADDIAGAPGQYGIAATSYVEKNSPVLFATLDQQETQAVLSKIRGDADSTVYQAPTLAMCNGQNAAIFSGSQRPFVVGLNRVEDETSDKFALQPVIRVISEGTVLKVNAEIIEGEGVNLDCRLECSTILNVETVEVPIKDHQEQQASIQVPEVATTRIQSSLDVPAGKTLVLSSIQRKADGKSELFLAFLTCFLPDSENPDARRPTIKTPPPEQPQATKFTYLHQTDENGKTTLVPVPVSDQPETEPLTQITVRSEEPAKGNVDFEPLVEAMEFRDIAINLEGNVEFEFNQSRPTIRGKKLCISMEDSQFRLTGDAGEMRALSNKQFVYLFAGNVELDGGGAIIRADELTFDQSAGYQMNGSVSIKVDDRHDGNWECSADSVQIDLKKETMTLKGTARYVREGDRRADIQAKYIEVNLDTGEIKTSDSVPESAEADLFSFYQGILR